MTLKKLTYLFDIICFLGGVSLTAYYLSDFSIRSGTGRMGDPVYAWGYFYENDAQLGIAIGISLIVLGFVIRNWSKRK